MSFPNRDAPWWHPAAVHPDYCSTCGASAASLGKDKLNHCGRCKRAYYCSRDCQRKHWLGEGECQNQQQQQQQPHRDYCAPIKYLQQDLAYLSTSLGLGIGGYAEVGNHEEARKRFVAVTELQRIAAPIHQLRSEANVHFEAKRWKRAACAFEVAIRASKDAWREVLDIFKELKLEKPKDAIACSRFVWQANEGRMYSNMIWSYMQMPKDIMEREILKHDKDQDGSIRSYDMANPNIIISMINSKGLQVAQEFLHKLYSKAVDAMERNPEKIWWKSHYRRAQVLHCTAQPIEAMKSCEEARHATTQVSPFYSREMEEEGALDKIQLLEEQIEVVLSVTDDSYSAKEKSNDGKLMGVCKYLASGFTPLSCDHPRLPMSSMREEMLAVRLIAATEIVGCQREYDDGTIEKFEYRERAVEVLNKILTTVAQAPLCLFPATGSGERVPPITVHLLAFFFRACLSPSAMKDFGVEAFCREATEHLLTDEQAYAIAAHAFEEVESIHNPNKGHAKTFNQTGQGGCMPCSFRLLRAGMDNWSEGLQMSVHKGKLDWTAFCLNRLLEGIDGGKHTVIKTILARDQHGCNAMMHAANDNFSGYSGLSIRMLVQATSYSTPDFDAKAKAVRKVLNTSDLSGFTPAMACVSVVNMPGLAVLVDLGARLWDKQINRKMPQHLQAAVRTLIKEKSLTSDTNTRNLFRAIQSTTEDRQCCSYCGKCPGENVRLLYCSRCNRSRYCGKECQRLGYKKHKYVCTTAKVEHDAEWYASNISAPSP